MNLPLADRMYWDKYRPTEDEVQTPIEQALLALLDRDGYLDLRNIGEVPEYDPESVAEEVTLGSAGARRFTDEDLVPPPPMPLDRIDPEGITLLYGDGGVGKGVLASSWIVRLVQEGQKVAIIDYEHHPREWARRISSLGGREIALGDDVLYFQPTEAIDKAADGITKVIRARRIDVAVVDSVVMACEAATYEPGSPDAPRMFLRAHAKIGVPILALAHIAKGQSSVWGSVFWANVARMSWRLERTDDAEVRTLTHDKTNNYENRGKYVVETLFTEDGSYLPLTVTETAVLRAAENTILEALQNGAMWTLAALQEECNQNGLHLTKPAVRRQIDWLRSRGGHAIEQAGAEGYVLKAANDPIFGTAWGGEYAEEVEW